MPVFIIGLREPDHEDPIGRPSWGIPARHNIDSEPSYIVPEVVDSQWYGNPKSKFAHRFDPYCVAWEEYQAEESSCSGSRW